MYAFVVLCLLLLLELSVIVVVLFELSVIVG